jgi:hypothetical protein
LVFETIELAKDKVVTLRHSSLPFYAPSSFVHPSHFASPLKKGRSSPDTEESDSLQPQSLLLRIGFMFLIICEIDSEVGDFAILFEICSDTRPCERE